MGWFCRGPTIGAVIVAIGMTACDDLVCTLIGCTDGLVVQLEGLLPSDYTVVAEVPGSADPWIIECTTEAPCRERIEVPYEWLGIPAGSPDLMPDLVRVTVEPESERKSGEFELDYEPLYPNGRRCGPACHQATVMFEW